MWSPYQIGISPRVRSLQTVEGLGDRLRLIAFAERQAFHAFNDAIKRFSDAPEGLVKAWGWVALEEAKHESWLLKRLAELGQDVKAVPVSLNLYHSLPSVRPPGILLSMSPMPKIEDESGLRSLLKS